MILNADQVARRLEKGGDDPLIIAPTPNLDKLKWTGAASIDIHLGCWFVTCRATRIPLLDVYDKPEDMPSEAKLTKSYYVPFGGQFILHPGTFVLGVTLEWIRLPRDLAAYVIGRSSWGRYGLIIATATGVHPRFTGCLTLELSNVGEIPIKVKPGASICQLFVHQIESEEPVFFDPSLFLGRRKPILGGIKLDEVARYLSRGIHWADTDL